MSFREHIIRIFSLLPDEVLGARTFRFVRKHRLYYHAQGSPVVVGHPFHQSESFFVERRDAGGDVSDLFEALRVLGKSVHFLRAHHAEYFSAPERDAHHDARAKHAMQFGRHEVRKNFARAGGNFCGRHDVDGSLKVGHSGIIDG